MEAVRMPPAAQSDLVPAGLERGPEDAVMAYARLASTAKKRTTPPPVRTVRGANSAWFYLNDESIDVYVRPANTGDNGPGAASIWFRIWLRDLVRRSK